MIKYARYPAGILAIILGVVAMEGGYVNHPSDPGGETNMGITRQTAQEHGYAGPMAEIPVETVVDIYAQSYIFKPNFSSVIKISEPVGTKLVDAGVNVGHSRASKWYQYSLNSFSRGCKDYPCIKVDGHIGANTLAAHSGLIAKRGSKTACVILLRSIDAQQGAHYLSLSSLQDFTVGWFNHRIGNVPEESCENE